jgi:maltose-binding protein MalE
MKRLATLRNARRCTTILVWCTNRAQKISKALNYFLKAQKIQAKVQRPEIGITLTNIANSYLKQNNLANAADYYAKAKMAIDQTGCTRIG